MYGIENACPIFVKFYRGDKMLENISVILMILIIFILIGLLKKERKEKLIESKTNEDINMMIKKLQDQINDEKLENNIHKKTEINYKNVIKFLLDENNKRYKKYIHIENNKKTKEGIAVILYEDGINYFNGVKMKCVAFGDKVELEPLKNLFIEFDLKRVEIGYIDCESHTGKGIGTCIMNALTEILPYYGIEEIRAGLSSSDYSKRKKLYKFYRYYNRFDITKEITPECWGEAIKRI